MMKVLMINSVCGIRSTGRICVDIAKDLESEGHEVKIAYGQNDVPEQYRKYAVRIGNSWNVRLHGILTRVFDMHGLASWSSTRKFLKWADEFDPDLVWIHNIHGYYINYEMLFSWIKARPHMLVKWTLHDCWAFTGHCAYFSMIKCEKWKNGCGNCPKVQEYPKSYLVDRSRLNYQKKKMAFNGVTNMTLITPSQWLADLVKDSFLGDYKVEVRYNLINREIFRPTFSTFREKYGLQRKTIVLGVASAWGKRKGLNDFIKLSDMLDDSFVIVLVGLTKISDEIKRSRIISVGRTNNAQELAEIYTAADVFFNPTYEDNYPTVNLEAQACGTKVITYDTGGSKETIYSDDSLVIPTGNIEEAASLVRQLSDKNVRCKAGNLEND